MGRSLERNKYVRGQWIAYNSAYNNRWDRRAPVINLRARVEVHDGKVSERGLISDGRRCWI